MRTIRVVDVTALTKTEAASVSAFTLIGAPFRQLAVTSSSAENPSGLFAFRRHIARKRMRVSMDSPDIGLNRKKIWHALTPYCQAGLATGTGTSEWRTW